MLPTVSVPAAGWSEEEFSRLMHLIQARPDELRWTAIPWETDVWAARRLAAERHQPIFLWAMNGNPLGCT